MTTNTPEILAASRPDCLETQILLTQGGYALWECGDEGHYHTPAPAAPTEIAKAAKRSSRRKRGPFFLPNVNGRSCTHPNHD